MVFRETNRIPGIEPESGMCKANAPPHCTISPAPVRGYVGLAPVSVLGLCVPCGPQVLPSPYHFKQTSGPSKRLLGGIRHLWVWE